MHFYLKFKIMNKYIFTALIACVCTMFYGVIGLFACVVPVFLCVQGVSMLLTRLQHVLLLRDYATQTENIYVCAAFEYDPSIRKRAAKERKLLIESGNQTGIIVHELYYAYGENCNEDWIQYEARVRAFIAEDRIKRHKMLCKHQDFYLQHTLKQM